MLLAAGIVSPACDVLTTSRPRFDTREVPTVTCRLGHSTTRLRLSLSPVHTGVGPLNLPGPVRVLLRSTSRQSSYKSSHLWLIDAHLCPVSDFSALQRICLLKSPSDRLPQSTGRSCVVSYHTYASGTSSSWPVGTLI